MPQRPIAIRIPLTGRRLVAMFFALAFGVLLAQAAFWGVRHLSGNPLPYPEIQLHVPGDGYYSYADLPGVFTLVYTDHVRVTLTVRPSTPVFVSYDLWDDGRLITTTTPAFRASPGPDGTYTWEAGPLPAGANALVAESPPGHHDVASIWYLPRSDPYATSHITRSAVFTVTPDRIDAVYRVEYGPGAQRDDLHDLTATANPIPAGLFLKRVFYATNITFTADVLTSIGPHPIAADGGRCSAEVRATSDEPFFNPERLPILINVSPGENDEWTMVRVVASEGAHLRNSDPFPTYASGEEWSWLITRRSSPLDLECDFGGRIDPIGSPVAWGRYQLVRLLRAAWAWGGLGHYFGSYVVWTLPWIIPWLYGALASAPFIYLRATHRAPHVHQVATAGLGLAFSVAWAATAAQVVALLVRGMSMPGLVWAGALGGLGVLLFFHYELPPPWHWLLAVASPLLAGGLLAAGSRPGAWTSGLLIALFGAPFPAFILWLGSRAWRGGRPARSRKPARWVLLFLILLLLLLAVPTARRPVDFSPVFGAWSLNPGRELALLSNWVGLPYATLLLVLALLRGLGGPGVAQDDVQEANAAPSLTEAVRALQSGEETTSPPLALGTLLFAAFAVGLIRRPLTTFAALVPISPLLAWAGFRLLIHRPETHIQPYPLRVLLAAPRRRREITRLALDLSGQEKGEEEKKDVASAVAESLRRLTDRPERHISLAEVAFAWGGGQSAWERGTAAAIRALALVMPLGVVFVPTLAHEIATRAVSAFGLLETVFVFVGPFALRWLLYAFTLGYFFPHLCGSNGWEKGLYLGLVVALANLIQDTILYARSLDDVKGLLLEAGVTVLMLCIIGIWTFDWPRLAEAGGRLSDLRTLYGLSTVTGYLASMLPPVATVVVEATQGRLDSLLRAFIEMVLPSATRL